MPTLWRMVRIRVNIPVNIGPHEQRCGLIHSAVRSKTALDKSYEDANWKNHATLIGLTGRFEPTQQQTTQPAETGSLVVAQKG